LARNHAVLSFSVGAPPMASLNTLSVMRHRHLCPCLSTMPKAIPSSSSAAYSRRRPAKAGVVATVELVNATARSGDPDVSWAKIASGGSWHRQTLPARACSSHFQAFRLTRSYQLTPWVGRRREPAPRPQRRGCRLGATTRVLNRGEATVAPRGRDVRTLTNPCIGAWVYRPGQR
jgi:hypothetical protein